MGNRKIKRTYGQQNNHQNKQPNHDAYGHEKIKNNRWQRNNKHHHYYNDTYSMSMSVFASTVCGQVQGIIYLLP
jgi:hypothetical protein